MSPAVEELVAFVEKAYTYAREEETKTALAEFNNPNGRFVKGELSLFAYDLKGTTLVLPFQPELVGRNRWNATDPNGMFVIREIIRTALSAGGFVQHFSLEPADTPGEPKLSYVMKVGQDWVLGASMDGANKEDPFVRVGGDPEVREDLRSFVEEAIVFARERGREAALAEFNDRNGRFVRGNRYIFAYDYRGTTLALPFQPQLLGTSLSHLQDAFGVRTNWIQCLLAKQGGGFTFLHYHNPARNMAIEPKLCYAAPVDDAWWLGAGIYLSEG